MKLFEWLLVESVAHGSHKAPQSLSPNHLAHMSYDHNDTGSIMTSMSRKVRLFVDSIIKTAYVSSLLRQPMALHSSNRREAPSGESAFAPELIDPYDVYASYGNAGVTLW